MDDGKGFEGKATAKRPKKETPLHSFLRELDQKAAQERQTDGCQHRPRTMPSETVQATDEKRRPKGAKTEESEIVAGLDADRTAVLRRSSRRTQRLAAEPIEQDV